MGERVKEYEKRFAEYFGTRHSESNSSSANLLMIASLFFHSSTNQSLEMRYRPLGFMGHNLFSITAIWS